MSKTSKTIKRTKIIGLQLADIIKIIDPETPNLNNSIFMIDYIDDTVLKLINSETLTTTELKINKDQTIERGTITEIHLLSRYESPSYAVQNKLLPKTWINIYFGGNMGMMLTGEITNLEEDMIEIKRYPEGDFIYINFDYKGIPKHLPIEYIQIREPIQRRLEEQTEEEEETEKELYESETPEEIQEPMEELSEDYFDNDVIDPKPKIDLKNQLREFILNADAIKFEDEIIGNVFQYVVVDKEKQRYSIETQTNDLLDDLLSTIPTLKRKGRVLNDIHKMIERYKQLRISFSTFDENGNIISKKYKTANWKPIKKYYNEFNTPLYWLIPVVKNIKKIYVEELASDVNESEDIHKYEMMEDILNINNIVKNSSKTEQNRYSNLYLELNPLMTPFEYNNYENLTDIIKQVEVGSNMNVITENFDDFTSTFISNDIQKQIRFGMQQYTTGTTKLSTSSATSSSKMISNVVELTPADVLEITSFITLPEQYIRFSRINLPGTNILDKSIVSKHFINYSKILNNKTNIQNIYVDNINSKINFNEDNYLNNIKNFTLKLQDTEKKLDKNEIYNKFIDMITPNTEVLFNLIKKHIQSKLTITQAIEYLEPFYIYPDDVSYSHYLHINDFINNKISEYNKNYIEKGKTFNLFKQIKARNVKKFQFIDLIRKNSVFENYNDNFSNYLLSDIELLRYMLENDSSQLFNVALSLENIKLNYSSDIISLFQNDEKEINSNMSQQESNNTCTPYNIAKYYNDIRRLEDDNGHIVYYDRKYDTTNYNLLNDYTKEITYMETDEFYNFLIKDLTKKNKMKNPQIIELANTLIEGKKIVSEGDYGILHHITDNTDISNISYYIRKNNTWELADNPPKGFITDDTNILCNLQNECVSQNYNNENKCIPSGLSELSLRKKLINSVMSEFDKKYEISLKDQQAQINLKYEYQESVLPKLKVLKTHRLRKYNNKCYNLGLSLKENNNIIISPYFKLRDLILGLDDFIKKQNYIIKFVENFTRTNYDSEVGPLGEKESEHWLYCMKTDVRLFPTFKYKLATEYLSSPERYNVYVDLLIKEIGKLSDDGETWIDQHSGYIIKLINFDVEEGYEDGFKIKSREEMEEDAGDSLILSNAKKANIFDNPESKLIYNIINTITSEIGVNIDNQIEFIISNVLNVIKETLPSENLYKSHVKEMLAKGKQMPSYSDIYNSKIMYSTIGLILIAIQTSVPPVKTRKTYPGCTKSFSGFPFDGPGDLSSLNYLVCVLYSLNESWNFLKGVNKNVMLERLKKSIEIDLYNLPDVTSKISTKTDFLINDASNLDGEDYQVVNLTNFLPPLVKFSVKNVQPISDVFKDKLKYELKNGILTQSNNILVIQSKIIKLSLAIQTSIQEVINKKKLLLKSMSNQQYIENACCNEPGHKSAIDYFIDKDKSISNYNDNSNELVNILDDINNLYRATMFSTKINTKYIYPNLSLQTNEETIYLAFIVFCKFKSLVPLDFEFLQFCSEKPKNINMKDTNMEIIRKLKSDGLVYSNELFLKLLQVVNRNNIINININNTPISPLDNLYYFLNNTASNKSASATASATKIESNTPESIISDKLQQLLKDVVDIFGVENPQNDKPVKNLNVYLNNENVTIKENILEFLRKNSEMTKKKMKNIEEFLTNLTIWENDNNVRNQDIKISNESLFNSINFLKNYIHNLTNIFPNIILNQVNYDDIEIQKYWKLSANHQSDIINIIAEYYTTIKKYYGDDILQNVLQEIKSFTGVIKKMSREIPSYNSINYKNINVTPIFNERTSNLLFEHMFLLTVFSYVKIGLSDITISKPYNKRQNNTTENNTVESMEDNVTKNDIVEIITSEDLFVNQGNKRALRRKVADLLITYMDIMMKHKHNIDRSYDNILDTIFKLKEKEKDTFTDRLKSLTNEQRDVDTILKINKLGVWGKGLQKGLTTYVKETYDDEREFGEKMAQYEKLILQTKILNDKNRNSSLEDYMEQQQIDDEINNDNDIMHLMTDDYQDGNYGGDEIENYEEYY